jgi:hypothetical protein
LDLAVDHVSGRLDADIEAFAAFVHECVYERLDPQVLENLRDQAGQAVSRGAGQDLGRHL